MSFATGRSDMAGRLPSLKQQRALLSRSQWKMNVCGSHTTSKTNLNEEQANNHYVLLVVWLPNTFTFH